MRVTAASQERGKNEEGTYADVGTVAEGRVAAPLNPLVVRKLSGSLPLEKENALLQGLPVVVLGRGAKEEPFQHWHYEEEEEEEPPGKGRHRWFTSLPRLWKSCLWEEKRGENGLIYKWGLGTKKSW